MKQTYTDPPRSGLEADKFRDQPTRSVIPLLEMAEKYQFSGIKWKITQEIEETCPNNLDKWNIYSARVGVLSSTGEWCQDKDPDFNLPEPASAIAIARKFDIPAILPAAFYDLSTISPLSDWEARYDCGVGDENEIGERSARWGWLNRADLLRVFRGKESLAKAAREFSESEVILYQCNVGLLCLEARQALQTKINDHDGLQDVLRHLESLKNRLDDTICLQCRELLPKVIQYEREDIWDSLKDVFGLSAKTSIDSSYDWILKTD